MNTLLLLLSALATAVFCNAGAFRMPLKKLPSLRSRLIKEGKYEEFLMQYHLERAEGGQDWDRPDRPFIDDLFVVTVAVGTPYQPVRMLMDTTTADFWVLDQQAACTTTLCNLFNINSSTTFVKGKDGYTIGNGQPTGFFATDAIRLDDYEYATQEFGVLTTRPKYDQEFSGIFGLAWPALSLNGLVPPIQNFLPQLPQPVFSIWITRLVHVGSQMERFEEFGGEISIGGLIEGDCDDDVQYVPLSSKTYWQFPVQRFKMGSYSTTKKFDALSDTTSTFIGGPTASVNAIVLLTGAVYDSSEGVYLLPCDGDYPDMTFTIGGKDHIVTSTDFINDIELGNGQCALAIFESNGAGFGPDWVLGQTFMRAYCPVYDVGQARMGFATALNEDGVKK